jgi:hypothetical protein
MTDHPKPPRGLARRGRAFWRATVSVYELDGPELELLAETCRVLDVIDVLEARVRADGASVVGSRGQVRVHPAVAELRGQRALLGRLIGQLSLPDAEGDVLPSPASARARKAAETRWRLHGKAS